MYNVERDWVGSIEHTSYRSGGCCNTEEDQRGLRTPLFPPIGLQLQYWPVTRISYYTTTIYLLHSPYYPTAPALHKDVMQHNGIVQRHWGSLRVGAQGPPQALRGPRVPHSITSLLREYCFYRNTISQYSYDYIQYTLYIPDNGITYKVN